MTRYQQDIFPTAIGITEMAVDMDRLLDGVEWRPTHSDGSHSSFKAWSSIDLHILNSHPEMKAALEDEATLFAQGAYGAPVELRITTSWLTRVDPGGSSQIHCHLNSLFSGVWYPTFSSPINFVRPASIHGGLWATPHEEHGTPASQTTASFTPAPNMLIMFPSALPHQVSVNNDPSPRYSLAFNTFPRGEFGSHDSSLTLRG